MLTVDGNGANTSTSNGSANSFSYDPFGNPIPGSQNPQNFDNGSLGWEGSHQKISETSLSLDPMVMGARIYLPTIGRFTSMDPVDNGNANDYVYPNDPVNGSDLNGQWNIRAIFRVGKRVVRDITYFQINTLAVPVYATYYFPNRSLHAVNSWGNRHGTAGKIISRSVGYPTRPYLWVAEAAGLGGDIALDWLKQKTVYPGEKLNDEGKVDGILPRTRWGEWTTYVSFWVASRRRN